MTETAAPYCSIVVSHPERPKHRCDLTLGEADLGPLRDVLVEGAARAMLGQPASDLASCWNLSATMQFTVTPEKHPAFFAAALARLEEIRPQWEAARAEQERRQQEMHAKMNQKKEINP